MLNNYKPYFIIFGVVCSILIIFFSYTYAGKDEVIAFINAEETTTKELSFYVDVKGAVSSPGVYSFKNDDRVTDAIDKAGGLLKSGNTSNINLSQRLTSEMVVYVYTNEEIRKGSNAISCSTKCDCSTIEVSNCYEQIQNDKVNINTATEKELQTLTGIGEAKAKTIVEHRKENGNFSDIEQLKNISGIGELIFDKIKEFITV